MTHYPPRVTLALCSEAGFVAGKRCAERRWLLAPARREFIPAQAVLNSTPQALARDCRRRAGRAAWARSFDGCEPRFRAIRQKIETEPKIRKGFQDLTRSSTKVKI